ncbi:Hypothetical predicted protein [Paramuricea clavata]|uniref:Uncharacterized protein n=1 Tax=Paramuricea clavata TaxID=317549 RepID=A0A7D9DZ78_PARCT|nr:Hypothetical predicted protein [Paramuricea clavata]
MEFYNKVSCEWYEVVFDLNIAPLQFKNYVIEQRVSRWKIQKIIDLLKNGFENISSDKAKALGAQDIIEKLLANVQCSSTRQMRLSLGKPMNSDFTTNKLDELKSMKVKLEKRHTTIITNCNLLSGKISSKNVVERECKRKRKRAEENHENQKFTKLREFERACDITKIITSCRIKYESLENGAEKYLK